MAWLVKEGKVLASVRVARTWRDRLRGLGGQSGVTGALFLEPARAVHTLRVDRAIDVAFVVRVDDPPVEGAGNAGKDAPSGDAPQELCGYRVIRVSTVAPNRLVKPELKASAAIEAEAGAFEAWGLVSGDTVRVELRQ